jgi:TPP-dependent indolepyruvate ferredoxin oxidoreductase alpha subunit
MPRQVAANAELLRHEMEHRGLSVVIAVRECLETARRKRKLAEVKPS